MENLRRGRGTIFNRVDKLGLIGANVYVLVEINGKHFIFGSRLDNDCRPSEEILIC
jgi:hypothetical protein